MVPISRMMLFLKWEPITTHEVFLILYSILAILGAITGAFAIFGALGISLKPVEPRIYYAVAYSIGILLFLCLAAVSLKRAVNFAYEKLKYDNLQRSRTNLLIGYGLTTLLGNLPRILCFFSGSLEFWIAYGVLTYPIASIVIHLLFNMTLGKVYELRRETRKDLGIALKIVFLFVLFASSRFLAMLPKSKDLEKLSWFQFIAGLVTMPPSIEFSMILTGGLTLKTEKYTPTVIPPKETVIEEVNDSRLECEICLLGYSDTSTIPRILKECGHTICEECANALLKKNNDMHLFCPHCKTVTVVKGNASLLSKNHFVLDYLKEMKKIK